MAFRYGFKKEAQETSTEVRGELGLRPLDPLDPWKLAKHLDIPVWPLRALADKAPECVDALTGPCHGQFHAMIARSGRRQVIIHNDSNALPRQRNDISHELAHALLLHTPKLVDDGALVEYDDDQEDEAGWLGGTLLVTEAACLHMCRNGIDVSSAADHLGVSTQLLNWRINKTGARLRAEREARRKR